MRPVDYLEPVAIHDGREPLRNALPTLRAGIASAIRNGDEWRVLRPRDVVAFPVSRQLCDLPSLRMPTIPLDAEIDLDQLVEHDVWGATRGELLVGRIDSLRVVSAVPPGAIYARPPRNPMIAEMLHDLANAMTVATAIHEHPEYGASDHGALGEALGHAVELINHMRVLATGEVTAGCEAIEIGELLESIAPVLRVAARPARLSIEAPASCEVDAERWRLESVLLNLVLNASCQAGVIRVRLARRGEFVEIEVDDDGPGFSDAETTPEPLHGYGLRSIRRQARTMSGTVALGRSPDLGGARVWVQLPVRPFGDEA